MTPAASSLSERGARSLTPYDLDRVVAIDSAHTRQSRRRFFEKRLADAEAQPDSFVHIGLMRGGALRGFLLAHVLRGEFGRNDAIGVFDAIGVEPECQERGVGQALIEELVDRMKGKGVRSLHSQANWTNHDLLRYLDTSGFSLSSRMILQRSVAEPLAEAEEEEV